MMTVIGPASGTLTFSAVTVGVVLPFRSGLVGPAIYFCQVAVLEAEQARPLVNDLHVVVFSVL